MAPNSVRMSPTEPCPNGQLFDEVPELVDRPRSEESASIDQVIHNLSNVRIRFRSHAQPSNVVPIRIVIK